MHGSWWEWYRKCIFSKNLRNVKSAEILQNDFLQNWQKRKLKTSQFNSNLFTLKFNIQSSPQSRGRETKRSMRWGAAVPLAGSAASSERRQTFTAHFSKSALGVGIARGETPGKTSRVIRRKMQNLRKSVIDCTKENILRSCGVWNATRASLWPLVQFFFEDRASVLTFSRRRSATAADPIFQLAKQDPVLERPPVFQGLPLRTQKRAVQRGAQHEEPLQTRVAKSWTEMNFVSFGHKRRWDSNFYPQFE